MRLFLAVEVSLPVQTENSHSASSYPTPVLEYRHMGDIYQRMEWDQTLFYHSLDSAAMISHLLYTKKSSRDL